MRRLSRIPAAIKRIPSAVRNALLMNRALDLMAERKFDAAIESIDKITEKALLTEVLLVKSFALRETDRHEQVAENTIRALDCMDKSSYKPREVEYICAFAASLSRRATESANFEEFDSAELARNTDGISPSLRRILPLSFR